MFGPSHVRQLDSVVLPELATVEHVLSSSPDALSTSNPNTACNQGGCKAIVVTDVAQAGVWESLCHKACRQSSAETGLMPATIPHSVAPQLHLWYSAGTVESMIKSGELPLSVVTLGSEAKVDALLNSTNETYLVYHTMSRPCSWRGTTF